MGPLRATAAGAVPARPPRVTPGAYVAASAAPAPDTPREFFGALESLRGVAALLVAVYHVPWINPAYHWGLVRNEYLMVDFFFVLSGFVICHSYSDKLSSSREFGRYVWLRLGRLYPLHLVLLLVWVGVDVAAVARQALAGTGISAHINFYEFGTSLLLIQGLDTNDVLVYNYPSWSISAELYTCIAFGAVVLLLRRKLPLWSVSALISASAFGIYLLAGQKAYIKPYHLAYVRCAIGFFLGVVVYEAYKRMKPTFARVGGRAALGWATTLVLAVTIAFLAMKSIGPSDFLITPLVAVIVLLVAGSRTGPVVWMLNRKPLVWLGRVSYSVYMVHAFVHMAYSAVLARLLATVPQLDAGKEILSGVPHARPIPVVGALFLFLTLASVCALSHLTYVYIEDPFRNKSKRLASRWFGARRRTVSLEGPAIPSADGA